MPFARCGDFRYPLSTQPTPPAGPHLCAPTILGFAIVLASAVGLAAGPKPPPVRGEVVLTEKAMAIHRDALLIDGHNDLP